MQRWTESLKGRISRLPMLNILVAVVAGVVIADHYVFPLWCVVIGIIMLTINAVVLPRGRAAVLSLFSTVTLTTIAIFQLHTNSLSRDYRLYDLEIDRISLRTERYTSGECRVVGVMEDEKMESCHAEVRFMADSTLDVRSGDRLTAFCRVKPFDRQSENRYDRYMSRRGMAGSVWLNAERVVSRDTTPSVVSRLRRAAEEHISQLGLAEDEDAVVKAVTIGRAEHISRSLRDAYRRSGASHLLAVSGLHVGFVCVIAAALLVLLLLLPHGQILRSIAVVALIWLYAAVVGFTPSIVRAALMFSLLQITIAFASRTLSLNTLCLAAVIMLWWDPYQLWDAGFLLSCLAVTAIIEWGVPLMQSVLRHLKSDTHRSHRSFLRGVVDFLLGWVISAIVVSVVATAATMPLTAYLFGMSSLWAIVISPLMVLLCAVVVGFAMFWILFPFGFLLPVVGCVIDMSASAMNAIAVWCASKPTLIFEEYISGCACAAIYLIYMLLTVILWSRR